MEVLYHYCSTDAFYSIIKNNSIWLSSLSLSNDSLEGKLVSQRVRERLSHLELTVDEVDMVHNALMFSEDLVDGLGFSMSKKGDLLSQWRGYADNGNGFSIGFSHDYLMDIVGRNPKQWKNSLQKVIYSKKDQEEALCPIIDVVNSIKNSGRLVKPRRSGLLNILTEEEERAESEAYHKTIQELWITGFRSIMSQLFVYKSDAFLEEDEMRLVFLAFHNVDENINYRSVGNKIVPYYDMKLSDVGENNKKIIEVIIGPKNQTPISVIKGFLKQNGFNDVNVRMSSASYR